MEVGIIHRISSSKRVFPTSMQTFMEINVQSVSESLFSVEQIKNQEVSLKSSEVYLSIDIKYMGVVTKGST